MSLSLWGEDFEIQPKSSPEKNKKIVEKINKPKKTSEKSTSTNRSSKKVKEESPADLEFKLKSIRENVLRILGVYKEQTICIYTKEQLHDYVTAAIENGIIAIDTETNNSLEPITCKLMGPCIYTPGQKNAYIPINHVDLHTRERLENQLTEQDVHEEFSRLYNTKIIMHNGKFDYKVIKCTTGLQLKVFWDTLIAVRMLDENEKSAGLKQQYIAKIDPSIEKYSIEHLFEGLEYAIIDPELFALYAATDAFMTYKLYEWQKRQFEISGHERLYDVFLNVEMPVMEVAAEMELTGICIDSEFSKRLSDKYHKKLDILNEKISEELSKYDELIAQWRLTEEANYHPEKIDKKTGEKKFGKSKNEQLKSPVELTSPTQLAILIYDVLKHPVVDKNSPRGTGEEILVKIDIPLSKLILEQRGLLKLIGTYIDKLPTCVLPETGRLHAQFQQLGADTGRFSSKDPNLQNIPSHEKSIRMMFTASDGNVLVGSDFSQQEPRLLANYANETNMINAYVEGKDLYATIAAGVYHNDYWDNMEFRKDGTANPEGKKRRGNCKSILLGIMYGRGVASIAEQVGCTTKEAQKIVDDFFTSFPKIETWVNDTQAFAKSYGYVEDLWGRRRRLPDIQLPRFEVKFKDPNMNKSSDFNPLLGSKGLVQNEIPNILIDYETKALKCNGKKAIDALAKEADAKGISIRNNGGFIAQAERQSVNARVQGGAATMSKKAMIRVYNDEILNKLGFKLMLAVHDELIGECPKENADAVADRLCEVMKLSALPECKVPFKCDPTITKSWYEDEMIAQLKSAYDKLTSKGSSHEDAVKSIIDDHTELTELQIYEMLKAE